MIPIPDLTDVPPVGRSAAIINASAPADLLANVAWRWFRVEEIAALLRSPVEAYSARWGNFLNNAQSCLLYEPNFERNTLSLLKFWLVEPADAAHPIRDRQSWIIYIIEAINTDSYCTIAHRIILYVKGYLRSILYTEVFFPPWCLMGNHKPQSREHKWQALHGASHQQ